MRLRSDDRGVTLPEVLVAVTILAIIIVPLADALIGFVRNTDATTRRMNESHDIQIASTYFVRDVQNLGVRDWSSPNLALQQSVWTSNDQCTGPGTPVISLAWDDPAAAPGSPPIRVTYLVRDSGGEPQLRRLYCPRPSIVDTDLVVVHNLDRIPDPPVCLPSPCSGAGAAAPQRVTLTVNIRDPANSTPTTVDLTGQRGQS